MDYYYKKKKGFFNSLKEMSATAWIIWINVIVFFVILFSLYGNQNRIAYFALNPLMIFQGKYLWTLVVHMFSHVLPAHLFVNMFALLSLGRLSERIIGKKRFIWFYLISGLFAGFISILLSTLFGYGLGERIFGAPNTFMLGASGAIFAIAGLFVILLPRLKFSIIFLPFWSFPAYKIIPAILIIMWALSISIGLPIGNTAHLGGFIAGLFYGLYLKKKYKRKVLMIQSYFKQ
jgi:membrane associated rhomboid family serine protease